MFIAREKELQLLNKYYRKDSFELLILYGRRRVGKTSLLTEFIKGKKAIFFSAEENNDTLNLENCIDILWRRRIPIYVQNMGARFSICVGKNS